MGMGVGEQVRKIELDTYAMFMKATAITGMSWDRDELATKLRRELHVSNDDHTRIRDKLSEDERVSSLRDAWLSRQASHAAKKARLDHVVPSGGKLAAKRSPLSSKLKQGTKHDTTAGAAPVIVDDLICRKVQRFWPEEGGWFDAVITDYRPATQEHCLTYEINTKSETFEWANLRAFNAKELKILEDRVPMDDLKFFSEGMKPGAEMATHNNALAQTHAVVGGVSDLVKKAAKTADAGKIFEAKGTLSAQEDALKAQLAALGDSDSEVA